MAIDVAEKAEPLSVDRREMLRRCTCHGGLGPNSQGGTLCLTRRSYEYGQLPYNVKREFDRLSKVLKRQSSRVCKTTLPGSEGKSLVQLDVLQARYATIWREAKLAGAQKRQMRADTIRMSSENARQKAEQVRQERATRDARIERASKAACACGVAPDSGLCPAQCDPIRFRASCRAARAEGNACVCPI